MGFIHYIIGLTGNTYDDELAAFSNAGADLILLKPLKLNLLDTLLAYFNENGFRSMVMKINYIIV
jgi:hypothetical protein